MIVMKSEVRSKLSTTPLDRAGPIDHLFRVNYFLRIARMSSKIQLLEVGRKNEKSVVTLRNFALVKPNEVREPSLNFILLFRNDDIPLSEIMS